MKRLRALFAILTPLLWSAVCFGQMPTTGSIYDPYEQPEVTLSNEDGKEIRCSLSNYDFERELIRIQLTDSGSSMWISAAILDDESKMLIYNWRMQKAIYDYLTVDAQRANTKNSGSNPKYEVSVRNFGSVELRDIELHYRLYKKGADHFTSAHSSSGESGLVFVSGSKNFNKIAAKAPETEFVTSSIAINKSKLETSYYSQTYYTDGSVGAKVKTGGKKESNRDSLKGLAIHVYYKGLLIKKWYSDNSLEALAKW